ncbi:MAG: ACT domain-containing protein [Chloroflexi bacterium]|nr:ACT domain-containing protein [Chloroflexota bacterium]
MCIKQISVSLDNVPGSLLDVSQFLGAERINIRAISVADITDICTVRLVVDDPEKTVNVLKSHGYSVKETDVIALEVPDHPGGLQAILKPLKRANINVLYLYPFLGRGESGNAIVIMGVNKTEEAIEVLKDNWVRIFGDEVYAL